MTWRDLWIVETACDVALLTPILGRPFRSARGKRWKEHASTFAAISQATAAPSIGFGPTRIKFLSDHLDVLDRKFAVLLQFQALLAVALGILLGPRYGEALIATAPWLLIALAVVWLLNTILCLRGVGRVRWGDLLKPIELGLTPADAEEDHVDMLVKAVVLRTARFRAAVLVTVSGVALLAGLGGTLFGLNAHAPHEAALRTVAVIKPFPPGASCGTWSDLEAQIAEAVRIARRDRITQLLVIGSGDAVPVGDALRGPYGNNTGLALSRARCVAGWLAEMLAAQQLHVAIDIRTRDALDRSSAARITGSDLDRAVTIMGWSALLQPASTG